LTPTFAARRKPLSSFNLDDSSGIAAMLVDAHKAWAGENFSPVFNPLETPNGMMTEEKKQCGEADRPMRVSIQARSQMKDLATRGCSLSDLIRRAGPWCPSCRPGTMDPHPTSSSSHRVLGTGAWRNINRFQTCQLRQAL